MKGFRRPGRVTAGIAAALAAALALALAPLLTGSVERALVNRVASLEAGGDMGKVHDHSPSRLDLLPTLDDMPEGFVFVKDEIR